MKKGWEKHIHIGDCDMIIDMYNKRPGTCKPFVQQEKDLPFIPRKGDYYYMSDNCSNGFISHIQKCWNSNKCKNCQYVCGESSEDNIYIDDFIEVETVTFDAENKIIDIWLKEPGNYEET